MSNVFFLWIKLYHNVQFQSFLLHRITPTCKITGMQTKTNTATTCSCCKVPFSYPWLSTVPNYKNYLHILSSSMELP